MDGRRHHPAGVVGRGGATDRVKEATVLGTGGRLRRLAAMWVVSMLGTMTPGEMWGGGEGEGLFYSSLDLCKNFFGDK